ncbi:MAG: glycosyltransferase [Sphingomicrobium sp.]
MRLCQIVEAASGGTGRHVLDLSAALHTRGHDVTIVYSPLRADPGFDAEARHGGARMLTLAMRRQPGLSDLVAARGLSRLVAERGPFDVVHAHSSKAGAVVRLAAVGGAARVYTPHALATLDPDRGAASRSLIGLAERLLGPRTDALIAVSLAEYDEAGRLGIAASRRYLIANRLQQARFTPRDEARAALGATPGQIWVGFAGRLVRQKAPLMFVAAVIAAMRRAPGVRALILGDGEQAPLVEQAIAASEFADRFTWHREARARDWLAALDLFVITSRFEGLPYVLLEALAAAVPVLSTPVGGASELLGMGSGVVASSDSLPAMLLELVARPERLSRLAYEAGRGVATSAGPQMIDRTEALYRKLMRA